MMGRLNPYQGQLRVRLGIKWTNGERRSNGARRVATNDCHPLMTPNQRLALRAVAGASGVACGCAGTTTSVIETQRMPSAVWIARRFLDADIAAIGVGSDNVLTATFWPSVPTSEEYRITVDERKPAIWPGATRVTDVNSLAPTAGLATILGPIALGLAAAGGSGSTRLDADGGSDEEQALNPAAARSAIAQKRRRCGRAPLLNLCSLDIPRRFIVPLARHQRPINLANTISDHCGQYDGSGRSSRGRGCVTCRSVVARHQHRAEDHRAGSLVMALLRPYRRAAEVLRELGYDEGHIAALNQAGAVAHGHGGAGFNDSGIFTRSDKAAIGIMRLSRFAPIENDCYRSALICCGA